MPPDRVRIHGPALNDDGITTYRIFSPYQRTVTYVEVITPTSMPWRGAGCPVLYILPVTAGMRGLLRLPAGAPEADRIGNGILVAKTHDIANRYGVVCVAPSFSDWPWIADHPTDRTRAQESHLLRVILPFIEAQYAVSRTPAARLVLGFSKSGMAAFSLVLRHPDVFGFGASWDAPMLLEAPDRWNMEDVYGTRENYLQYYIPELLKKRAAALRKEESRLVLTGSCLFKDHVTGIHDRMLALGIPHDYSDVEYETHLWGAGWFPEAVQRLMALYRNAEGTHS